MPDIENSRAYGRLKNLTIDKEDLLAVSIQVRPYSFMRHRAIIAATSKRVLILRPKLISGYAFDDFQWQDLKSVQISAGILYSSLSFERYPKADLSSSVGYCVRLDADGFEKTTIEKVYQVCEEKAQEWRELRRARDMEERRANGAVFNR